ncbi:hypothetical protein FIBSPDRAFT_1055198 [Athelia psychrophila]|uniref:Uncharacterized protein n=1 Tax=Athelia psychrophila TaxID=1759441 RepID=A0A167U3V6_9AGAM|nr:hypothetical protein FIBSPDRAFT_1055198 [Fibularhizoctonia sp. CBS 109695]
MKWPLGVLQARAISSMMSLLDLQYLSTGVAQSTQTNCTVVEPWEFNENGPNPCYMFTEALSPYRDATVNPKPTSGYSDA